MDKAFWEEFDRRFDSEVKTVQAWFSLSQLTAVFSIILIGTLFVLNVEKSFNPSKSELAGIIQEEEFLDNMDMLEFMAANELTNEDMEFLLDTENVDNNEG